MPALEILTVNFSKVLLKMNLASSFAIMTPFHFILSFIFEQHYKHLSFALLQFSMPYISNLQTSSHSLCTNISFCISTRILHSKA